jgi:two-component system, NtrC family, response regulator AtoC
VTMTPGGRVLLVDDEEKILKTLGRALRDEGHDVTTASRALDGQRLLAEQAFDLLIIDYRMPDRSGMDVVKELVATTPDGERPAIVMMTAHGSVESAVEAMKLGAHDYLQKPFEVDELLLTARRALAAQRARTELTYLRSERDADFDHYGIVGRSKVMIDISKRIELVAQSRSTVLLTGETGTGKELVARAIHDRSQQRHLPLIKVNCAAIPDTLIESELFGHVRGAFTGAISAKKGRFALADGGTIFLDEIATLGPAVQAKLLRVLQEREFEPLGSERTEKVDVRIIAATNRDLRQMATEGRFQEDLYYRLHVIPIELPPLRQRLDDLPALVDHFVQKFSQRLGKRITGVDADAMAELKRYHWPGNVRELENTIERAVVLTTGPSLTPESVWVMGAASAPTTGLPSLRLHQNVEWVERETIRHALERARGVKKDAAELMGLSQRALSHYLAKYRID